MHRLVFRTVSLKVLADIPLQTALSIDIYKHAALFINYVSQMRFDAWARLIKQGHKQQMY